MLPEPSFPIYTDTEIGADKLVHGIGIAASLIALAWLMVRAAPGGSVLAMAAIAVYGAGLLGMLTASALYNFAPIGRLKSAFRQLDHAMIFVMIAGSYTPFVLLGLPRPLGGWMCGVVWCLAAMGVALRLLARRRPEWVFLALYLGLGWLVLAFLPTLAAVLSPGALACLVAGGVVYSIGAVVHRLSGLRFHNVAWHALVVLAAGLHVAAVAQLLPAA